MGYQNFTVEDFIQDENFIKWVKEGKRDQQVFWEEWLIKHPEKKPFLDEARTFIEQLQLEKATLPDSRKAFLLDNIHAQMDIPVKTLAPLSTRRNFLSTYIGVAAAVVLLLLVFFNQDFFFGQKNSYHTDFQESKEIDLPDGSHVTLNANSSLTIEGDWKEEDIRTVTLEGEAFFSVESADKFQGKKFVVQAGEMNVEVLGTEFNVNQREEKFQVVLTEGKVRIASDKAEAKEQPLAPIALSPGQMASFDFSTQKLLSQQVNTEVYTSWKSDQLVFDFTPIHELLDILRYSYGYEVSIEDPEIMDKKLSGTLPNVDPETLLKGLSSAFNIEIISRGDKKIALQARK